jgi:1-acyl-sn-glycerol-3-phosphate acyltransferase
VIFALRRIWHVMAKSLAFTIFGIGALLLAFVVFPTLRLIIHPETRYRLAMRSSVSLAFRSFVWLLRVLGIMRLKIEGIEQLRSARGMVIVANHPSLLDVVILIAYIPRADCIVKSKLWSNPFVRRVVSNVYIPNMLDPETALGLAQATLAEGNNLVIFPEGTRTVAGATPHLFRGFAHIALGSQRDVLPVRIDIPDLAGLGKGDHLWLSPHDGLLRFTIRILSPLRVARLLGQEAAKASRILTQELQMLIL